MAAEDPADRRAIAKIAANTRWAAEPSRALATAPARAKGPGSQEYWINKVDPDQVMTHIDRIKAADNAKSAYFAQLARRGRKAKKQKQETRA